MTHVDPATNEVRRTPSQQRAHESVQAIVRAATEIIEAEGYEAYNTNTVAKRAGVSVALVYRYFPNKESILVALWEETQNVRARTVVHIIRQIPTVENWEEYARMIMVTLRKLRTDQPNLMMMRKIFPSVPQLAFVENKVIRECGDALVSVIKKRFAKISDAEAEAATMTLLSMIPPLVDATMEAVDPTAVSAIIESNVRLLAMFFTDLDTRFK